MKTQRGFTLAELVVAVAVTGIIVAFFGTAIHQILTVSAYGNDRLTAAHELENAAFWFNFDGQRAETATGGSSLSLSLPGGTSISYTLTGAELRRNDGGSYIVLARNITAAAFTVDARVVTMILTSAPAGRDNVSQNGTYYTVLRPAGGGE